MVLLRTRWALLVLLVAVAVVAGCSCPLHKGPRPDKPEAGAAVTQKTCPVMGGPVNTAVFIDYEGQRVYFCCPECIDVFKKNPQQYLNKLGK